MGHAGIGDILATGGAALVEAAEDAIAAAKSASSALRKANKLVQHAADEPERRRKTQELMKEKRDQEIMGDEDLMMAPPLPQLRRKVDKKVGREDGRAGGRGHVQCLFQGLRAR